LKLRQILERTGLMDPRHALDGVGA
jgi:hypothetical protein